MLELMGVSFFEMPLTGFYFLLSVLPNMLRKI
jgi:hypothetical protein